MWMVLLCMVAMVRSFRTAPIKSCDYIGNIQLRNDRDFVLAALTRDGQALEYVCDELRNDRDIVLAAMRQNGRALDYASGELRNDRDLVLQ